jgi:hypothetical protein
MGISRLNNQYTINGVMPTEDSVLANLEKLAASSGCWISYDIHQGKWAVIINRAGVSTRSFNDSNIIGAVTVQGTGLTELYNSVRVSYPRSDLNDVLDWIQIDLPAEDRNFNEPDQPLEMQLPLTNDPVQAQLIGTIELKQNRVDKVIVFETDYSAIDVNAGDIIDITNSTAGFEQKLFRVVTMRELDGDDGSIRIEITALEYDDDVYDVDLSRFTVTTSTGIVTAGAIGLPGKPTLNIFERDTRPRTVISTTVPAGLVNGIEFWLSQQSETSGYQLVGIERPVASTVYTQGQTVTLDVDNINAGNVFVRTRAFNATVDGPFSETTTGVYAPVQVTNAVDPNTGIVDVNGNLLTALAITELLKLIDGLKSNGDSGTGSLFAAIFDVFNTATGVDIVNDIPTIAGDALDAFTTIVVEDSDANTVATLSGGTTGFENTVTLVGLDGVVTSGFAPTNDIFIGLKDAKRMNWISGGRFDSSAGPWPNINSPLTISSFPTGAPPGTGSVESYSEALFVNVFANYGDNRTAAVDSFKRLIVEVYQNNNLIATLGTSATTQDYYDDLNLMETIFGEFYPDDIIRLEIKINSNAAQAVGVSWQLLMPLGILTTF